MRQRRRRRMAPAALWQFAYEPIFALRASMIAW
jgi:hypothetical protein